MESSLRKLQKIEADILQVVSKICDEEQIRYYLSSGTLLGAVRHQGFIPWDDDIDIMIPRPDYERFLRVASEKLPPYLALCHYTKDCNYPFRQAKVVDKRYQLVREIFSDNKAYDVWIDVFPLDGLPKGRLSLTAHKCWITFHMLTLKLSRLNYHGTDYSKRTWWQCAVLKANKVIHFSRLLSMTKEIRKFNDFLSRYPFEQSEWCINCFGEYIYTGSLSRFHGWETAEKFPLREKAFPRRKRLKSILLKFTGTIWRFLRRNRERVSIVWSSSAGRIAYDRKNNGSCGLLWPMVSKAFKKLLFLIGDCRDFVSAELFHAASGIGQSL